MWLNRELGLYRLERFRMVQFSPKAVPAIFLSELLQSCTMFYRPNIITKVAFIKSDPEFFCFFFAMPLYVSLSVC